MKSSSESQQAKLRNDLREELNNPYNPFSLLRNEEQMTLAHEQEVRRYMIDITLLMKDFDTEKMSIEADWNEWLKKTSFQLLK